MNDGGFGPWIEGLIMAEEHDRKMLKPCPFCGSFARLTGKWCKKYWVKCAYDKCNASVYADTEEKAIEYWNRRVGE